MNTMLGMLAVGLVLAGQAAPQEPGPKKMALDGLEVEVFSEGAFVTPGGPGTIDAQYFKDSSRRIWLYLDNAAAVDVP